MPAREHGRPVRINKGDPLPSTAAAWNHLVDAVDFADYGRDFGGTQTSLPPLSDNSILIKNDLYGADGAAPRIERGQIAIIEESLNQDGEDSRFRKRPAKFISTDNEDDFEPRHWSTGVVAPYHITNSYFGQANITGTIPAQLYMPPDDRWMEFADIDLSRTNPKYLTAHPSGSWQILYHDLATRSASDELGWAVVRYVGPQQRLLKARTKSSITYGSSATVDVYLDDYDTEVGELTAHYVWEDVGTIATNTRIAVKWFCDELKWIVRPVGTGAGGGDPDIRHVIAWDKFEGEDSTGTVLWADPTAPAGKYRKMQAINERTDTVIWMGSSGTVALDDNGEWHWVNSNAATTIKGTVKSDFGESSGLWLDRIGELTRGSLDPLDGHYADSRSGTEDAEFIWFLPGQGFSITQDLGIYTLLPNAAAWNLPATFTLWKAGDEAIAFLDADSSVTPTGATQWVVSDRVIPSGGDVFEDFNQHVDQVLVSLAGEDPKWVELQQADVVVDTRLSGTELQKRVFRQYMIQVSGYDVWNQAFPSTSCE